MALAYLQVYLEHAHKDAKILDSGLIRSSNFLYLGATPDGLLNCSCCDKNYVIEIKCPAKCEKKSATIMAKTDKRFCMMFNESDEKYYLRREHEYYYQVQLQMLFRIVSFAILWFTDTFIVLLKLSLLIMIF